tara:strand:+ start:294 stop:476 length:183 start_codon:yes stop_codon:yes gene_type:complete
MKVGDLVHNSRYPYWGIGMIVDLEKGKDGMICVYWLPDKYGDREGWKADWRDKEELEILC